MHIAYYVIHPTAEAILIMTPQYWLAVAIATNSQKLKLLNWTESG